MRSLMAPLTNVSMLIPNAAVSEIVGYIAPQVRDGAPSWYAGDVPWRGLELPLVKVEAMLGRGEVSVADRGQIMVIPAFNQTSGLRFIGIQCQGIPRLVMADQGNLSTISQGVTSPVIATEVLVEGKPAFIPDLDLIEKMVARIREQSTRH